MTLSKWLCQAAIENGDRPGPRLRSQPSSVTLDDNRFAGNQRDFDGYESWLEAWRDTSTTEADLSEHKRKIRSLGLDRRLEKLDPENGAIALELQSIANRARGAASGAPVATKETSTSPGDAS